MPISIVLLTDTHALYKVNNTFHASPSSGFSFTRTRYIWRNDLQKRVWKKKIWQPLHWYGTPNERWIETDWILGTYIPIIIDHCRTLYCVLLRFYRVRLFFWYILHFILLFRLSIPNRLYEWASWMYAVLSRCNDLVSRFYEMLSHTCDIISF